MLEQEEQNISAEENLLDDLDLGEEAWDMPLGEAELLDIWFDSDEADEADDTSKSNSEEDTSQEGTDGSDNEEQDADKGTDGSDNSSDTSLDDDLKEIDDLLASFDKKNEEASEDIQAILESLKGVPGGEQAVALIENLQTSNAEKEATIQQIQKASDDMKMRLQDIQNKNVELEATSGIDDPTILYIHSNIWKARAWDGKTKVKMIAVLDKLRKEFAGKTIDEEENESLDDKFNLLSNVGKSGGWLNKSGMNDDDFDIELR